MRPHRLTELTDEMLAVLRHVMTQRPDRRQVVHRDGLNAPAFVFAERAAMATAVHATRHRLGLPAVDESEVEACEDEARGHAEYARMFALYCAQLAVSTHPELRLAPGTSVPGSEQRYLEQQRLE